MLLKILSYPDKRLLTKSVEVKEITPEIQELAKNMAETMYQSKGVGIAAPQIGQFIRLIVIDQSGPDERNDLISLVNPSYEPLDKQYTVEEEGCLSVPELREKVKRHARIKVNAQDLDGNKLEFEADDYLAIIIQHECDHLEGKLFLHRLSYLKRSLYEKKHNKG